MKNIELNKISTDGTNIIPRDDVLIFNEFNHLNKAYRILEENILELLSNTCMKVSLKDFYYDLRKLSDLDKNIYNSIMHLFKEEDVKELENCYFNIIEKNLFIGNYPIDVIEDNVICRRYGSGNKDIETLKRFDVSDNLLRVFTNLCSILRYTIKICKENNTIYFKYFSDTLRNLSSHMTYIVRLIYNDIHSNDNYKEYYNSLKEVYGFIRNGKLYKVNNITQTKPYSYTFLLEDDEKNYLSISDEDAMNMNLSVKLNFSNDAIQFMETINIPVFK